MSNAYSGIDGSARKIVGGYIGVDGVARKLKKAYIGVDGVARLCWNSGVAIPEGGTYYTGVTTQYTGDYTGATSTLTAGDNFPETVSTGDVYVYGDYEYRYNYYKIDAGAWSKKTSLNGWSVVAIDKTKSSYGKILNSIQGKPIAGLNWCFSECRNATSIDLSDLDTSNVKGMSGTFYYCSSLTSLDLSSFDTNNVTIMTFMFRSSSKLTAIYVGDGWDTSGATVTKMFTDCGVSSVTYV